MTTTLEDPSTAPSFTYPSIAPSLADASVLLTAWEEASTVPAPAVGAALLYRCGVAADLSEALDLPLATASALLAQLYAQAFGDAVDAVVTCATCGEELEVVVPLQRLGRVPDTASLQAAGGVDGLVVRCPTGRDLVEASAAPDPATALLARCVVDADGDPVNPATLDDQARGAVDLVAERLAGAAAVVLRSHCPVCNGELSADVDVPALLWQRISSEVPAVLAEVGELCAAFGWSEADVLAMSGVRRDAYLSLLRARS